MADEPKPADPAPESPAPAGAQDGTNISPAPAAVSDAKPGEAPPEGATPEATATGGGGPAPKIPADPLSDGTVPTVLNAGATHRSVPKGKASITSIYRRADITTTLITFVIAIVVAVSAVGIYAFLTRKTPLPKNPAVTSLSQADLDKLGAFFQGNSAGQDSQILTISASSLFKNRVAMSSDLKVVGAVSVTGPTSLGDLLVDKTSTLGVTNIRGQLTVTAPSSFQAATQFSAGVSVNGNLAVTGNGSFGGSVSAGTLNVSTLSVTGTLNLNGHISVGGVEPGVAAASGFATSASLDGNDAAGTVTVTVPPHTSPPGTNAQIVTINFHSPYPRAPHVVITPVGAPAAMLQPFVLRTATSFTIGVIEYGGNANNQLNSVTYAFDYWISQ